MEINTSLSTSVPGNGNQITGGYNTTWNWDSSTTTDSDSDRNQSLSANTTTTSSDRQSLVESGNQLAATYTSGYSPVVVDKQIRDQLIGKYYSSIQQFG